MDDLSFGKLELFIKTSGYKTLLEASRDLGYDKTTMSRHISAVEQHFGVKVFERAKKTIILTSEGRFLLESAKNIVKEYRATKLGIKNVDNKISGNLRISTTHPIASTWLSIFVHEFLEQYPEVNLDIVASALPLDLAMKEADLALRPACDIKDTEQTYVRSWILRLFASRKYIQKYGAPKTEVELDQHKMIVFGDTPTLYRQDHTKWSLGRGPGKKYREPYITINNLQGMYQLIKSGLGIGTLSYDNILMKNTDLVQVLESKINKVDLFFICHNSMVSKPIIQAFKDFILEYVFRTGNEL